MDPTASVTRLNDPVTDLDHSLGPIDAPVTLLEYGDFECPDCGRAYPLLKDLKKAMDGQLRFVFRHFPLFTIHRHAGVAAQAAEIAAAQGKFWDMHDQLYEHQKELADLDIRRFAMRIGLEFYKFEADLAAERYARRVREDYEGGVRSGVTGTPTLFINEIRYTGNVELDPLLSALKAAVPRTPAPG